MSRGPIDPAREGAETSFEERMAYGDYLRLDRLLEAQEPLSKAHDEVLFIIQHQVSELWMKLAIHEISSAMRAIRDDELRPAFKMLTRVARVFEQLNNSWDVLRTMTPSEYTEFRGALGQSSGFQSWQYRADRVPGRQPQRSRCCARIPTAPRSSPSWSASLPRPASMTRRSCAWPATGSTSASTPHRTDWREMRGENPKVVAAWREVYAAPERHWMLYELAEKLVDFEDYFRRWRFNHVTTVERIIGLKRGTGGTAGVAYLRKMLEVVLFPELWNVRTQL